MYPEARLDPIDYLVIGHISRDLNPGGDRLGGTATYSALTARALGLRVGIVTSWAADLYDECLADLNIFNHPSDSSTTFENLYEGSHRTQVIHEQAERLDYYHVPPAWRDTPLVHIGPVANEIEPGILRYFNNTLLCATPQGWLRGWDAEGNIFRTDWPEGRIILRQVDAAVISQDDVNRDEDVIAAMAEAARVLVVTDGLAETRVYFEGQTHSIQPMAIEEVDPTGAGDIFAAAFFTSYQRSGDPLKAAQFASRIAAPSVTRIGLDSVPTQDEVFGLLADLVAQP
jgi:sugar/nucleoside kinase (ribokinase family)